MSRGTPDTRSTLIIFDYGTLTLYGWPSQTILLTIAVLQHVHTPEILLPLVWPLPISLATTFGISFDFSSSAYLDVSVQRVPSVNLSFLFQLTVYSCEL